MLGDTSNMFYTTVYCIHYSTLVDWVNLYAQMYSDTGTWDLMRRMNLQKFWQLLI